MTLLDYLAPLHGGVSSAKRLIQVGAVKINGATAPRYDTIYLYQRDLVQVGKHWSASII